MPETEPQHWSLMLLDTYILYKGVYLLLIIILSIRIWDYRFILHKFMPSIVDPRGDLNRYLEHEKWWKDEQAKNIAATQAGGGENTYSIKTWTIVLLFSLFLFILAILFPTKTIDSFSNVTMPSMFKDSILDTNKSDSDRLSFLFRDIWPSGNKEKYTVSKYDEEDIKFIRETDVKFRTSNDALLGQNWRNITVNKDINIGEMRNSLNLKTVCGGMNNDTKLIDDISGTCLNGIHIKGDRCHNLSKSPCCQRYCPSRSWGGWYYGDGGEVPARVLVTPTTDRHPNWQCNTKSTWDGNVCWDENGAKSPEVYKIVSPGTKNGGETYPAASSYDQKKEKDPSLTKFWS